MHNLHNCLVVTMKNYLIISAFVSISLFAIAAATCQHVRDVGFNIGGGPVFHTDLDSDYKYYAYSIGGNIQLSFIHKGNFTFGVQAGLQQIVQKFQITEFRWNVIYHQYMDPLRLADNNQPDVWVSKNYLWQFLLNSNYQFQNSIILEGSIGANLIINGADKPYVDAIPLIGLGGGYLFRVTKSISIPLQLKTCYEFNPRIESGTLKIYGGSLYPAIYSGIVFSLDK